MSLECMPRNIDSNRKHDSSPNVGDHSFPSRPNHERNIPYTMRLLPSLPTEISCIITAGGLVQKNDYGWLNAFGEL